MTDLPSTSFIDQVVLITGAGKGLGRALAEAFAAHGAVVAANDLTPINLDETLRRIAAAGGRAQPYLFDVAKRLPIQSLVETVHSELGRLDILINNAAVAPRGAILSMDEWDFHRTLDVNVAGPFFTMQQAGRVMLAHGGGVIVNLGAAAGPAPQPELAAYLASKAALAALTRAAALELAPHGIRVHAVCPQPASPPAPIVAQVLRLCSPAAAHLTGQIIEVSD
jgi:NAD(P)-dependent dehydrogenase (short-subunit alcohol dehydrogenase family)